MNDDYDLTPYAKEISKIIINDIFRIAKEKNIKPYEIIHPTILNSLFVALYIKKYIDRTGLIAILEEIDPEKCGTDIIDLLEKHKTIPIDFSKLDDIICSVFNENKDKISGNPKLLNWTVGQVIKQYGKTDASYIKTKLESLMNG